MRLRSEWKLQPVNVHSRWWGTCLRNQWSSRWSDRRRNRPIRSSHGRESNSRCLCSPEFSSSQFQPVKTKMRMEQGAKKLRITFHYCSSLLHYLPISYCLPPWTFSDSPWLALHCQYWHMRHTMRSVQFWWLDHRCIAVVYHIYYIFIVKFLLLILVCIYTCTGILC